MGLFDELQGHHPVKEAELLAKELVEVVEDKPVEPAPVADKPAK